MLEEPRKHPMAEKKPLLLRIPPDLWESLNLWAKDELRSVNAQIEYILRQAVRKRAKNDDQALEADQSDKLTNK